MGRLGWAGGGRKFYKKYKSNSTFLAVVRSGASERKRVFFIAQLFTVVVVVVVAAKPFHPPPPPPSASNQLSWQRLDRKLSSDISIKNVAGAFASVPKRIAAFFTSQLFCLSVFLQQTDFERKKKDKGRKKEREREKERKRKEIGMKKKFAEPRKMKMLQPKTWYCLKEHSNSSGERESG